ncbi:LysR family transcriptional regulator [Arabiibacter massiliensis]|uniref:LysR family transcriptional regulator n=1 Tax=Arabiibacter massiliensis TaxID=1870985 RepID=UPI0009BAC53B|nr:LysR family transcriptional regulator [Arabiibacter massiliensis]
MNIKQVDYFVSAANRGSLSAAARDHGISVQAMSKAMTDLEKELPAPLFDRTPTGISLTPFGQQFYARAKPVCEAFTELQNITAEPPDDSKLKLFLCAPAFSHNAKARAKMAAFFDKYLHTESEIVMGRGEDGLAALDRGECDAVITIGVLRHPDYDCLAVGTVPAGVCISKNHPLSQNDAVTLEEIRQFPVLSSKMFDHFNDSIFVMYNREGVLGTVVEPDLAEMPFLFYFKHAITFMVNIPPLGEMMPFSVMKPLAEKDMKPVPLCLITAKGAKSAPYRNLEALLFGHPRT